MAQDSELKAAMARRDKKIMPLKGADWQEQLRTTDSGGIKRGSLFNIRLYIENDPNLKGMLAYDEFSGKVIKTRSNDNTGLRKGDWQDTDDSLLRAYFDEQYNILFSKDNVFDAMIRVARLHPFDPVKKRIEAVKWDGQPRAETFFIDYLGAEDNHYMRQVTRKWLAGAVARVYHPGIKFEIIPMLDGGQGLGKSTTVKNLYPEYFNDNLKTMGKQKDDYQKLTGSWIIELAELSAMQKTDIETMKNFTSATSDYYRNSYGRYATQHPRRSVFIGSTNQHDFLKDFTGERRFYPIRCGLHPASKNPLKPVQDDILQTLAEVKTWVDAGEKLYFDQQTLNEAKAYQQEAQVIDPMKDAITDYLEMLVPTNWDELTISVKHSYFTTIENGGTIDVNTDNWLNVKLDSGREPIQKTSTREILAVVFDQQTSRYLVGRTNSDAKKIKLIMDNMPGWEYKANVVINGKRGRGYERITD
ncbi:virulence-associated E family protein [Lactiplantibacillus modestisalitolerans]|uniref:VapE domain-containing protein n=1 Tax=Lactiplantibacillus modestisalitolerans TaxID=1457219 RepID=A0ABV5WRF1_9LACO|nr:virulence-associated E family protein [Lactiplantibacillus modestisalitolerans]